MNQSLRFIQCSSHKFDSCLLDNILYKLETAICFCFLSVGCTFFRQFWEFVPVLSNFKLWCPTGLSPRPYFIFTACMSFCLSFPQTQIFFSSYLLMTYSCQTTPPVERIIIFTLAYYCGIIHVTFMCGIRWRDCGWFVGVPSEAETDKENQQKRSINCSSLFTQHCKNTAFGTQTCLIAGLFFL